MTAADPMCVSEACAGRLCLRARHAFGSDGRGAHRYLGCTTHRNCVAFEAPSETPTPVPHGVGEVAAVPPAVAEPTAEVPSLRASAAGDLIDTWAAWLCRACGSRFLAAGMRCCDAEPTPVRVWITRRTQ